MVPENLADRRFCVQVDTTPKAEIPSSTRQVARYNRVLNRTAVIHHKFSASRNPDRHDRVIMVSGKRAGTEENWVAYLDFNDATQNSPPVIEPDLKTLYIFYPERFFPMVDEVLRSPFTTPICLVDLRSHPFGSVEASGPMPFRR